MDVSEDAFHYNLKQDMRASELVGDRRYGWRSYKNCFVGSETVSWIAHTRHCSYEEAEQIGQAMLDKGLFRPLQGDMKFENNFVFYRFQVGDGLILCSENIPSYLQVISRKTSHYLKF